MGRVYRDSPTDARNEGAKRQLEFENYDETIPAHSLEESFEYDFDKMVRYAENSNERYAIGYIRMGAPKRFSKSDDATKRLYEHGEQREQEYAIQHYARENGYVKFHSVVDEQVSKTDEEISLSWLRMMLTLCERKNATLLYCELGSIYRHSDFFALIRKARKRGIKIVAIRDIRAVDAALRHALKPKKRHRRGSRYLRLDQAESARKERNPILIWKDDQLRADGTRGIPTKQFKNYEHLYKGVDPIYEFFIKPTLDDPHFETPHLWQAVDADDRKIADDLNDGGYLTVGGFAWTKETVRKARHLIFSDEFKRYCNEKRRIELEWEEAKEIEEYII